MAEKTGGNLEGFEKGKELLFPGEIKAGDDGLRRVMHEDKDVLLSLCLSCEDTAKVVHKGAWIVQVDAAENKQAAVEGKIKTDRSEEGLIHLRGDLLAVRPPLESVSDIMVSRNAKDRKGRPDLPGQPFDKVSVPPQIGYVYGVSEMNQERGMILSEDFFEQRIPIFIVMGITDDQKGEREALFFQRPDRVRPIADLVRWKRLSIIPVQQDDGKGEEYPRQGEGCKDEPDPLFPVKKTHFHPLGSLSTIKIIGPKIKPEGVNFGLSFLNPAPGPFAGTGGAFYSVR